jgi:ubiquinone/menaquinone biosynthesis C-methylase UbiE
VHRFDNAEQWAKEFDNPARDEWQRPSDVVAAMKIAPGMTVVDLGAGTGYFLPHLSRAVGPNGKVIALDIEPGMVQHMTERAARQNLANVQAKVVPLDGPQLAPGTADRVLIVDTWHHIAERPAYAKKLLSALTADGAVYIVDFTLETHRGPPKEHRITAARIVEELRAGGFAAEAIDEPLPDQYIVVGKHPGR